MPSCGAAFPFRSLLRHRSRVGRGRGAGSHLALAWLLAALMLVPLLGRWHQLAHAGAPGTERITAVAAGQGAATAHRHGVGGGHSAGHAPVSWLDSHAAADCLLFDQLTLSDAIGQPLNLALFVVLARPAAWSEMSGVAARHAARAVARGPPGPWAPARQRA